MLQKTPLATKKQSRFGLRLWLASLQYFLVQLVVGLDFVGHYSLAQNTISDLGNTACGHYGGRMVCSPLHSYMNLSFVAQGILMAGGAALIYRSLPRKRSVSLGFSGLLLAGIGTIIVGLFPENSTTGLHAIGAALPFVLGNLGLLVLGLSLQLPKPLRIYTLVSGGMAIIALGLFVSQHYLGLGDGGMERLTAYPQTIWLIVYAVYYLRQPATS